MYDLHGGHTELTACAHEAAHAVMRYHFDMEVTDLEIFRMEIIDMWDYSGRCLGAGEDFTAKGIIECYAAGFAWEWRTTLDLFDRYLVVNKGDWEFGDAINDCRRISDLVEEKLNLSNNWSKLECKQFKDEVEDLFQRTWEILEKHYLRAISAIAFELSKVNRLPAGKVEAIIRENIDPKYWQKKNSEVNRQDLPLTGQNVVKLAF